LYFLIKGLKSEENLILIERIIMSNPLDTKIISRLAEILDKTNLTELEYEDETCRISLSRQCNGVAVSGAYVPAQAPVVAAAPAVAAPTAAPVAEASDTAETDYTKSPNAVKSPMVGVVYLSADPKSPNYVKVGDTVAEGDTVCLVEAMKTFNPVKAHKAGKVAKILVESGDPVEYGEPLVVIE
jgi:acetyl-CoA carboxylase biotin carboxyl carrier protein